MDNKKVKSKSRCSFQGCNKKLKLTDLQCRCNLKYCQLHRLPEKHNCSYDIMSEEKKRLKKKLMSEKTVNSKVIPI